MNVYVGNTVLIKTKSYIFIWPNTDLAKKHEEGAFKSLIVAAPPTALGALRKAESANLKKAIVADIHKDWTHMPVYEIEQAVTKALAE